MKVLTKYFRSVVLFTLFFCLMPGVNAEQLLEDNSEQVERLVADMKYVYERAQNHPVLQKSRELRLDFQKPETETINEFLENKKKALLLCAQEYSDTTFGSCFDRVLVYTYYEIETILEDLQKVHGLASQLRDQDSQHTFFNRLCELVPSIFQDYDFFRSVILKDQIFRRSRRRLRLTRKKIRRIKRNITRDKKRFLWWLPKI